MNDRRAIQWALLVSLLLHLLLVAVTWRWTPLSAVVVAERNPEPPPQVTITLSPPEDAQDQQRREPTAYTSIPERQAAEAPPAEPDFLALHDALAADEVPGGEPGSQPAAPREAEVPQVAISRDEGGAPDAIRVLPVPPADRQKRQQPETAGSGTSPATGTPAEEMEGRLTEGEDGTPVRETGNEGEESAGQDDTPPAPDLARLLAGGSPSILRDDRQGRTGDWGFDYDQSAAGPAGGNAIRFGEYTLSTSEWDYAPWLERFKQDFLPHWIPPYAYLMGVISGTTTLRLTVEIDGSLSDLEVLEKKGHESLHQHSVAAMRATAPFAPLPPDFPDSNLVLVITLHYPPRTPAPDRRAPGTGGQRHGRRPGRER